MAAQASINEWLGGSNVGGVSLEQQLIDSDVKTKALVAETARKNALTRRRVLIVGAIIFVLAGLLIAYHYQKTRNNVPNFPTTNKNYTATNGTPFTVTNPFIEMDTSFLHKFVSLNCNYTPVRCNPTCTYVSNSTDPKGDNARTHGSTWYYGNITSNGHVYVAVTYSSKKGVNVVDQDDLVAIGGIIATPTITLVSKDKRVVGKRCAVDGANVPVGWAIAMAWDTFPRDYQQALVPAYWTLPAQVASSFGVCGNTVYAVTAGTAGCSNGLVLMDEIIDVKDIDLVKRTIRNGDIDVVPSLLTIVGDGAYTIESILADLPRNWAMPPSIDGLQFLQVVNQRATPNSTLRTSYNTTDYRQLANVSLKKGDTIYVCPMPDGYVTPAIFT